MAKRPAEEVEVEAAGDEEEAKPETTLETALIFGTTIALVVGIVVGLMELGKHYGAGPFGG